MTKLMERGSALISEVGQAAELVNGYLDGYSDHRSEYPEASNRSAIYRHGWLNGRDDRAGQPRACAAQIRDDLAALEDRT